MSDDDKKASDDGPVGAPPPDFDEDLVTQLTPGDELARWRRISARDEKPVFVRDPLPRSPANDAKTPPRGTPIPSGAIEKTPPRGTPSVTATPPRGTPAPPGAASAEVTPPRGMPSVEATPARAFAVPGLNAERESAPPKHVLRDAPVPMAGRTSPVPPAPRASAPPRLSPIPKERSSPDPLRPSGEPAVFSSPPREPSGAIPLLERRSVPPSAGPPSGYTPGGARPLDPSLRPKTALAPPPPSLSLPPRSDPSIPPAPPLGFDSPSAPPPIASAVPAPSGGPNVAMGVALLIVLAAVLVGGYLASTGGLGLGRLGGSAPTPPPPVVATPTPAPVTALPDAGPSAPAPLAAPSTPDVAEVLAAADAALRAGNAAEALEGYRTVVELDVHDPYGHAGAARALLALDRAEEAISFASRAVAHRQRRAAFRVLLGDAYEAHHEHDRAVAEWRTALELEPDDHEAHDRLGE